jgi:hypothetical protein
MLVFCLNRRHLKERAVLINPSSTLSGGVCALLPWHAPFMVGSRESANIALIFVYSLERSILFRDTLGISQSLVNE